MIKEKYRKKNRIIEKGLIGNTKGGKICKGRNSKTGRKDERTEIETVNGGPKADRLPSVKCNSHTRV
jgi:hypothetical protein